MRWRLHPGDRCVQSRVGSVGHASCAPEAPSLVQSRRITWVAFLPISRAVVIDGHTVETPALFAPATTIMMLFTEEALRMNASSASEANDECSLPIRRRWCWGLPEFCHWNCLHSCLDQPRAAISCA